MAVIGDTVRRVLNRLFPKGDLEKKLNVQIATSNLMDNAIELWRAMYQDVPPWLGKADCRQSMSLPAAIAEEFARLTLTEFEFSLSGGKRAEYITEQMQHFMDKLADNIELWAALGGIVVKPYVTKSEKDAELDEIHLDVIQANRFYPAAFNSNQEITAAVFLETKRIGDYLYTRLEYHSLVGKTYTVTNKAFKSERINTLETEDDRLSVEHPFEEEVPLTAVDDWQGLAPEAVLEDIEKPLFVYVSVPRANNIDPMSPLGASVYSRAVGLIEEADRQWSRIQWEYEAKEPAVDADESLFAFDKKGHPILPQGRERIYRTYQFEAGEKPGFFSVYSPEIRDSSLFRGLNEILKRIEFNCGLAYGTLSDPNDVTKTAEEIRASKQRSYTTINKMQVKWDRALEDLVYVMDVYCTLYNLAPREEKLEISCTWGDGVLEDTEAEYQRRWSMVLAGKLKVEKFYEWYFGCSEEEAKEMVPVQGRLYPPPE